MLIDDKLYERSANWMLLKCFNKDESLKIIGEVCERIYDSCFVMKRSIYSHGYYCPIITIVSSLYMSSDANLSVAWSNTKDILVELLHRVVKPWSFEMGYGFDSESLFDFL